MSPEMLDFLKLALLGFLVGGYGTLVGAGGGSVLVPVLLLMMPQERPATITAMSLAVVFFNAYTGTMAYVSMRRVDYRLATLFTLASVPGAIVGVFLVHELPRAWFDPVFGLLLLALGCFLVLNPLGRSRRRAEESSANSNRGSRSLLGAVGSAYIAVLASVLGIGGGVVHVPFLVRILRQRPHIATATSQFVLTFMALTATLTHVLMGGFQTRLAETTYLAVGVMMGAPLGAALSARLHGSMLVRLLAVALCLVGVRLLFRMA